MEKEYTLWHVASGYRLVEGTYNSYEAAYEAAKKLDEKYNDETNYWEEKVRFYIAEEGLRPAQLKKLLSSNSYLKFHIWDKTWRDILKEEQERKKK